MGTGEALHNPGTKEGKEFTVSGNFDELVSRYVYPRFKGLNLSNEAIKERFLGQINGQLLKL